MSAEDRAAVEGGITAVRDALKGSDADAVKRTMDSLVEVLQKMSTNAYQASQASAAGGEGDASGGAGSAGAGDETVEGEFKEV